MSKADKLKEYKQAFLHYQEIEKEMEWEFLEPKLQDLEKSIREKDNDFAIAMMGFISEHYLKSIFPFHQSALDIAVEAGNYPVAKWLTENHSKLMRQVNTSGNTPLHMAALYKHQKIVKLLLDHGTDNVAVNNKGETPADCARIGGEGYRFPANDELAQFIEQYETQPLGDAVTAIDMGVAD